MTKRKLYVLILFWIDSTSSKLNMRGNKALYYTYELENAKQSHEWIN